MRSPRWVSAGCALVLMMSACGDDRATSVEVTTAKEPIDLLYISDSSGRVTAEHYATLIEQQLGAEVRLTDWRTGDQMLSDALARIRRSPDVVAAAEIIVLWGNPWGSGIGPDIGSCLSPSTSKPPPVALTDEYWAPFREQFETTLAEIWTIRKGAPVVLRVTDMYVVNIADWRDVGVFDACTASWEAMSAAVKAGAEAQNAVFVSTYDVYNGPQHDQDPRAMGYLGADGIHPTDAGGTAMASALAAVGFEPSTAP